MTPISERVLIYSGSQGTQDFILAYMKEGQLTEYHVLGSPSSLVGQIRLGRIEKILKNLSAAFVDIGEEKQAFLPLEEDALNTYKNGQELILEIKKDAYGNKGATVTDRFSLRSEHVVLSYGNTLLGVSKKITDEKERLRLKEIARQLPVKEGVGYVLRTESQGMPSEALIREAAGLMDIFTTLVSKARYSPVGSVLHVSENPLIRSLKDLKLSPSAEILTDDPKLFDRLKESLILEMPERVGSLRLFKQEGSLSMAAIYKIESQLKEALSIRINLSGPMQGGYLFIEETQACVTIDVNTGKEIKGESKEEAITSFNTLVTSEIARQIRLRNLSGMILIDFVDMEKTENKKKVREALIRALSGDPRPVNVYDFTKLQLLEMTRKREGLSLKQQVTLN